LHSNPVALPQPLGHVVVGLDPSLLEAQADTLDVALRLCRMAAESAGRRGNQCAPTMIWSEQSGRRERERGGRGFCARPPSLRSKNARCILFCHLLNQVFTHTCVPPYPSFSCFSCQRVCHFIEWFVLTNLDEARGASSLSAPVG
jgi:hypothetical protein